MSFNLRKSIFKSSICFSSPSAKKKNQTDISKQVLFQNCSVGVEQVIAGLVKSNTDKIFFCKYFFAIKITTHKINNRG